MPRFIAAQDIPMKLRRPHIKRYQAQLRDALLNPALSDAQRVEIHDKLAKVGQPKPYAELAARAAKVEAAMMAASPASAPATTTQPGAVDSNPVEPVASTSSGEPLEDLLALSQSELLALAENEGVEAFKSWSKTRIAEAILENRSVESI